jgi:hexosaminidase
MLLLSISSFSFCQTKSDFDIKAFYIDCRHEVMTLSAIKQYAKELSQHGINTISDGI